VFDPSRPVDDRARQMLASGAQVAGLLLEVERANGRWPLASARSRSDGAAPLIGSSVAIRSVRDQIERVAATDFTVLVEGGSGPQPHPSFIEVSREATLDNGNGAVEGTEDLGNYVSRGLDLGIHGTTASGRPSRIVSSAAPRRRAGSLAGKVSRSWQPWQTRSCQAGTSYSCSFKA
jgi:hypothetical protein